MVRDKRFARRTLCTFAVFAAVFLFYLLTAAYVPYPGESATYLASLVFPWQYETPQGGMLGSLLTYLVTAAVSPGALMTAVSVLTALCGAIAVTAVFRVVYFTVQFSSLDLEGVRAGEIPRTTGDIAFCAEVTGLAAAAVAAVTVPLWAIATRPLPATVPVALVGLAWALAAELRYRQALLARDYTATLRFGEMALIALTAFFSFLALFTDMTLLLPLLPALIILFMPFVLPTMLFRLRALPCLLTGIVLAALAALGVARLWLDAFAVDPSGSAFAFWANSLSGGMATLNRVLFVPTEAIALALLALSAALMLGCFPAAYCSFGKPLIGQLVALAIPVAALCGWPEAFWGEMQQPSVLAVAASSLAVAVTCTVVGSWCRCWLDIHMAWRPARAYAIAGGIVFVPLLTLTAIAVWTGWRSGAGFPARLAFRDCWAAYEEAVGRDSRLWLSSTARVSDAFVLYRHINGQTIAIAPVRLLLGRNYDAFRDRTVAGELRDDPVVTELAGIGASSVRMYLEYDADYAGYLADADHTERAAEALVGIAEHLRTTDYGRTPAGKISIAKARAWAARCYAAIALGMPPADALRLLRLAASLNPSNRAYPLGIFAAAQRADAPVTADERLAVTRILEADPALRAPTWWQVDAFDAAEDVVRTPAFDAARRMRAVRNGPRRPAIDRLIAMYRTDPGSLSAVERAVALLELPEQEAGAILLERGALQPSDVLLYLAANPFTETSMALAKRYPDFLKEDEAVARCYDASNIRHMDPGRMTDMAAAYFAQKASNVRALLLVSLCFREGDIDRAREFVSGFLLEERLPRTAYTAEHLRLQVLRRLVETPDRGRAVAEGWLRSHPIQSALWTYLLEEVPLAPDERRAAVQACLAVLPTHPEASRLEAEYIRSLHGDGAAARYLNAVRRAASLRKEY